MPPMRPGFGGPPPGRGPGRGFFQGPKRREEPAGELDLEKLEQQSREMTRLTLLRGDNAVFHETDGGFLDLTFNGKVYRDVQIVRMFPFSAPEDYLSVRECGEGAAEIGIIEHLKNDFHEDSVKAIEHQLSLRYFLPVITKINNVRQDFGCVYFDVETDYGPCQFAFRSNSNAVTRVSENRIMIQDLDNNCFEIPAVHKLSASEQKKIDVYLT